MTRARARSSAALLTTLVTGLLCFTLFAWTWVFTPGGDVEAPSLQNVLDVPLLPVQHLYASGQRKDTVGPEHCAMSVTVDVPASDGGIVWGYKICFDGTLEKFVNRADHKKRAWSEVFFPPQAGEYTRRLEMLTIYAAKTGKLAHSRRYWLSGKLMQTTDVNPKNIEYQLSYAEDGITLLEEQVYALTDCCVPAPVILANLRWLNTPSHQLIYANIRNADQTRWVTMWDEHGMPFEIFNWAALDALAGTYGVGYYRGTRTVLFQSAIDDYQNIVTYFRPDHTKAYELYLSSTFLRVEYFDSAGTKTVMEQFFNRREISAKNGIAESVKYELYEVNVMDSEDSVATEFYFFQGKLSRVRQRNTSLNGTKYSAIDYFYTVTGLFDHGEYWLDKITHPPDRKDTQPPAIDPRAALQPHMCSLPSIDSNLPIPAASGEP